MGFFELIFFSIQDFYLLLEVNTSPAMHSQPWVRALCFISPSEKDLPLVQTLDVNISIVCV